MAHFTETKGKSELKQIKVREQDQPEYKLEGGGDE